MTWSLLVQSYRKVYVLVGNSLPNMTTTDTTTMIAIKPPGDKLPKDPVSDPDAPAALLSSTLFPELSDGSLACAVEVSKDPHISGVVAVVAAGMIDDCEETKHVKLSTELMNILYLIAPNFEMNSRIGRLERVN